MPCGLEGSLALHWPCVTGFSGLSTYGLTVYGREMRTLPTLLMGYDTLPLVCIIQAICLSAVVIIKKSLFSYEYINS